MGGVRFPAGASMTQRPIEPKPKSAPLLDARVETVHGQQVVVKRYASPPLKRNRTFAPERKLDPTLGRWEAEWHARRVGDDDAEREVDALPPVSKPRRYGTKPRGRRARKVQAETFESPTQGANVLEAIANTVRWARENGWW